MAGIHFYFLFFKFDRDMTSSRYEPTMYELLVSIDNL